MNWEDIKDIWFSQNGVCPATSMLLDPTANNPLLLPSIDRKDSTLGYTRENVQIVVRAYNYMKNACTEEQAQEIVRLLKNSH
jgi:hypothetical protein